MIRNCIFIVDSDADVGDVFKAYFSNLSLEVKAFTNVLEAITASHLNPPDLIFMDYETIHLKAETAPSLMPPSIPKFLIGAEPNIYLSHPFTGRFNKPFNLKVIKNTIDQMLKIKKLAA